jgi:hypothetical protein
MTHGSNKWVQSYRAARKRHADARLEAYDAARTDAITSGGLGLPLRFTDIDEHALEVWRATWRQPHSVDAGGWDWSRLVSGMPHRAAVLPLAIWYGDDLCGLALGYASRSRAGGVRHTVLLTHVERRPDPPQVPLRGHIIPLAVAVAQNYGYALGASRLLLRNPDPRVVSYYEQLGFDVAWKGSRPVYCEKEI